MGYEKPVIGTLNESTDAQPVGTWLYTEDVALGLAYVVALVVVSQIDATP